MIEVLDFHKHYDGVFAVKGLTFTVQPGQVLGLVGPNGAGKTTTLRAMCGIIPPTRGVLRIGGHDVRADPVAAKRMLAYVPDDPKLFDVLTVWEHLRYTAAAYDVPKWEVDAERLLRQFELEEKRNTLGAELSRGMRQKLAICCAYLHAPKALLLDEPLTGVDPHGIRTTKDSIRGYAQAGGAIIMSSHILDLVEDLCSHLLILHRGECLYFGTLTEARTAFDDLHGDATLEEIFLRATRMPGASPPPLDSGA
ncbi:MAG: ABC transporter ATP-binding protein [Candidatus Hydrogenedentes bacterium]|nr:ABC transporter ATP-binding protein [Candidatus Hydrogenedentota bacterium]